METEIFIAADDPVRLVSAVVERMEIEKIERSYSRDGRNEYPPRILLKVLIYAYMRMIYSSREIERACRENICFMYLLEDYPAPDHNTIARFRAERLAGCEKELLELAELFKMFADSTRIKILYDLFDGEKNVTEICEDIEMNQSAVSHQLRALKTAKLVKSRREGKAIYYALDDDHVKTIIEMGKEHIEE